MTSRFPGKHRTHRERRSAKCRARRFLSARMCSRRSNRFACSCNAMSATGSRDRGHLLASRLLALYIRVGRDTYMGRPSLSSPRFDRMGCSPSCVANSKSVIRLRLATNPKLTYVEIRPLSRLRSQDASMVPDLATSYSFTSQDPLIPTIRLVRPIDGLHLLGDVFPSTLDETPLFRIRSSPEDLLSPGSFSLSVVGGDLRGAEVGGFFELVEGGLFFGRFGAFVRVAWEARIVGCSSLSLRVSSGFSVNAAQVSLRLTCYDSGAGEGEDG